MTSGPPCPTRLMHDGNTWTSSGISSAPSSLLSQGLNSSAAKGQPTFRNLLPGEAKYRRPRTPPPRRVIQEVPWKRLVTLHPASYSSRCGLQDYWLSPQRRYPAGSAWHTPTKRLLVLPGSSSVVDVDSVHWPSAGQYRRNLIWKNRWQYLNCYYLGKRPGRFLKMNF